MATPAPSSIDLRRASSLADVLARARTLGLGHVLEQPLEVLYEVPGLAPAVVELLDEAAEIVELPTIGDLEHEELADFVADAGKRARAGLLEAVVHHLERQEKADETLDIERWAEKHQVSSLLQTRVAVLDEAVGWEDRRWLRAAGRTLRELFLGKGIPVAVRERLQKKARAYLVRQAMNVREALADEAKRLARPRPAEPAAGELLDAALAARARVREEVMPVAQAARERMKGFFEPDPPALRVVDDDWPHRRTVTLPLQARPLVAACSCGEQRCAHALATFDLLLDLLTEPRNVKERTAILTELARPSWARLLADLDGKLAPPEPEEPPARIVWRVVAVGTSLVLEPCVQRPRKGGGFTAGSRTRAQDLRWRKGEILHRTDREVLDLLHLAHNSRELEVDYVARALLALAGSGRVTAAAAPFPELTVDKASLGIAVVTADDGTMRLSASADGRPIDAKRLIRSPAGELAVHLEPAQQRCTIVTVEGRARTLLDVLARRDAAFPEEALPALLERLPSLAARVPVSLPPALRGDEVAGDERVLLRLAAREDGALRVTALCRPLPDGGVHPPGQGPAETVGWRDGRRVHARRDLAAEPARVAAALASLALRPDAEIEPFVWLLDRGEEALDLVAALPAAEDRFAVEWLSEPRVVTRAATAGDLRVRVDDRRDWFGVSGEVDVDGARVGLADLLAAIRERRRFVAVKGNLWVRIGDELRARLTPAGDHLQQGRSGLELNPMAAPALAELVKDDAPRRLREMLARRRAAAESVAEPPAEVAGALRDYQLEGWRWLSRLSAWASGACLADDMGVGKTVQALALLSERARLGPAMVVAPTSVVFNWAREARRFTPSLRPIVYREVDRSAATARLAAGDVLLVSYGLLARDGEELAKTPFATLVLDEAQAIKNPATQRARAAVALDARFRLALTGTPVENRLAELWSLFRVVVPGLLGSWERFRERFAAPIERGRDPERQAALARVVRPFILRRLKSDVARELPSRTEVREEIVLSPAERGLYEEMRRAILAELARPAEAAGEDRRFQVLAGLLRLRQLACHPRLVHEGSAVPSSKLERCLELIDELREGGHRALVFSQFTSHLALLREALDAAGVSYFQLDGSTPPARREELVDAFQAGQADLFLISLKAGGTGLNLTGADVVIHLDPWWNPAVEDQATDRAHRIGQERPVTIYRLVSRETVEEAILELHADKRRLVAGILDGTDSATTITTEELMALLRE